MLVRLVQMTFQPERVPDFLALFRRTATQIRAFPGCLDLELVQPDGDAARFATISRWADADALEAYRQSDLFRSTWAATKVWFSDRPVATSYAIVWPQTETPGAGEAEPGVR